MAIIKKPSLSKDPRKYLNEFCATKATRNENVRNTIVNSDESKSFLGGISKIGKLEIDSGITSGLGILSEIVSIGGPELSKKVDDGADGVLDTVFAPIGFSSKEVNGVLNDIDPATVNIAIGQAENVVNMMKNGSLTPQRIPGLLSEFKNLGTLAKNSLGFTGLFGEDGPEERTPLECHPSPYAADLISRGVKHKFMFVVEFIYNSPYAQSMGSLSHAFTIKSTQLPAPRIEYEEINQYNYRTYAPKFARFEPITMNFYDDGRNEVMNFYSSYLKTISPIVNKNSSQFLERDSMNYDLLDNKAITTRKGANNTHNVHEYSSSLGPLSSNMESSKNTILDEIRIYHVFAGGGLMNVYRMFNPRVTAMNVGELSMETGEISDINIELNYDFFHIDTNVSTDKSSGFNVTAASSVGGAMYPIIPVGGDVTIHPDALPADR